MKKIFEKPDVKVVSFESVDVIMDADDLKTPSMDGDSDIW